MTQFSKNTQNYYKFWFYYQLLLQFLRITIIQIMMVEPNYKVIIMNELLPHYPSKNEVFLDNKRCTSTHLSL